MGMHRFNTQQYAPVGVDESKKTPTKTCAEPVAFPAFGQRVASHRRFFATLSQAEYIQKLEQADLRVGHRHETEAKGIYKYKYIYITTDVELNKEQLARKVQVLFSGQMGVAKKLDRWMVEHGHQSFDSSTVYIVYIEVPTFSLTLTKTVRIDTPYRRTAVPWRGDSSHRMGL